MVVSLSESLHFHSKTECSDDGQQFTTLTVDSWQHLRRLAVPDIWLVPTKI